MERISELIPALSQSKIDTEPKHFEQEIGHEREEKQANQDSISSDEAGREEKMEKVVMKVHVTRKNIEAVTEIKREFISSTKYSAKKAAKNFNKF